MKLARIDDLVTRRPRRSQSILGVFDEASEPQLLLKLRNRKNLRDVGSLCAHVCAAGRL